MQPGDDMWDARSRWWSLEELTIAPVRLHPSTSQWCLPTREHYELTIAPARLHPSTPLWMLHRAVVFYRVWHDQPPVPLQPALDPDHRAEV